MRFGCIVCDPPWGFDDGLKQMKRRVKRSAQSHYPTMTRQEIMDLAPLVNDVVDPAGCVLALWVPASFLQVGLDVMKAWDFDQKGLYAWVKLKRNAQKETDPNRMMRVGMGRLFRGACEVALIGTRGKVYDRLEDHSQLNVAMELNRGHSTKPERLQDSLDVMFPNNGRLELFARRARPGWTCLGNEIDGKDIREAFRAISNDGFEKGNENETK